MRGPGRPRGLGAVGTLGAFLILAAACGPAPDAASGSGTLPARDSAGGRETVEDRTGASAGSPREGRSAVRPESTEEWPPAEDSISGTPWTKTDWEIFRATLETAAAQGLDTLPLGDAIARMGSLFLGTPYVPRTLEVPGPERLVVNLRGLDCVTFVESVLALTRFQRVHGLALLSDPPEARRRYEADLAALRYRGGSPDGYASRLHYFSEWLAEGEAGGRLELMTARLGGVADPEPLRFMTAHRDAYPQLVRDEAFAAVRAVEDRLAEGAPRVYLPEEAIAGAAPGIRNGDVIAATSTLDGLDVAHTGIAWWVDGELHLLHAPLVGSTVVLSERSLARRIREIGTQDGIMVARPLGSWFTEAR